MSFRRKPRRRTAAALFTVAMALALSAPLVGARASGRVAEPVDDPIPGHIANGALQLKLQTLTEGNGLTAPNWGTFAPGVPRTLFVVDQDGPLWAVDTVSGAKHEILDTASLLVPLVPGDERGFLGLAFHPGYATNGLVYTMTSERIPGTASTADQQPNHLATIREWRIPNPLANPQTRAALTPTASRVLRRVVEPQFNHNGGALFFGTRPADRRFLYITLGDGGCADDQHGQQGLAGEGPCISHRGPGNAQRLDNPLGKILRMDPTVHAAPRIFAHGFRNPFRASSDRADLGGTGRIWTADVGQNHLEEVDARIVAGGNYGWRVKEGTFRFEPNRFRLFGFASDGFPFANTPGRPAGLIDPVAQYDHDEGVATIGGFVYRGARFPGLRGRYVFGDYSDGLSSGNGRVMYVDEADRADPERRTPKVFNLVNGHINLFVLGFGEDAKGELYVLANKSGSPFDEAGVVMKLVRECTGSADCRD